MVKYRAAVPGNSVGNGTLREPNSTVVGFSYSCTVDSYGIIIPVPVQSTLIQMGGNSNNLEEDFLRWINFWRENSNIFKRTSNQDEHNEQNERKEQNERREQNE